MSDIAIRVENLSKLYHLGARQQRHDTLRDALTGMFRRGHQSTNSQSTNSHSDDLWALKDVSFEVQRGEVVGIIGRNGAGKSTLLKILSRITEPTSGRAEIHGRVGSLLEVGTGFHPELTGRENIYLNGAILGMRRAEIERKYDEIVAFSGVEKFLDTPVKRYSSGMYVRLAFAVAAHLEPEILMVDEVLAVGDADFQKKCLGKMGEVASQGRTVIFVSHNMGMITSLCSRALLLDAGQVVTQGTASETVLAYFSRGRFSPSSVEFAQNGRRVGDELATLLEAHIEDSKGYITAEVDIRSPFCVKMRYQLLQSVPKPPYANLHFFDARGEYAFVTAGDNYSNANGIEPGVYEAECHVPGYLLNNGTYFIGLALTFTYQGVHVSFWEKDALSVSIRDPMEETVDEMRKGYSGHIPGPVRPRLDWIITRVA